MPSPETVSMLIESVSLAAAIRNAGPTQIIRIVIARPAVVPFFGKVAETIGCVARNRVPTNRWILLSWSCQMLSIGRSL